MYIFTRPFVLNGRLNRAECVTTPLIRRMKYTGYAAAGERIALANFNVAVNPYPANVENIVSS